MRFTAYACLITWTEGRLSKAFIIPCSASWGATSSWLIDPTQGLVIMPEGARDLYAMLGMCQKIISGTLKMLNVSFWLKAEKIWRIVICMHSCSVYSRVLRTKGDFFTNLVAKNHLTLANESFVLQFILIQIRECSCLWNSRSGLVRFHSFWNIHDNAVYRGQRTFWLGQFYFWSTQSYVSLFRILDLA